MKSLGKKATGARLGRMQDSRLWAGDGFRNIHPILPGLRDLTGPRVTLSKFLCGGGERRVPRARCRRATRSARGPVRPTSACAPPGSATRPC